MLNFPCSFNITVLFEIRNLRKSYQNIRGRVNFGKHRFQETVAYKLYWKILQFLQKGPAVELLSNKCEGLAILSFSLNDYCWLILLGRLNWSWINCSFLDVDNFPVPQVFPVVSEDTDTNELRRILQISLISFVVFATIFVILLFIASWDRDEKRMKSKIPHNISECTW